MDDKRFDQMVRALGGKAARRDTIKSLLGGAVAGLGALGITKVEAKQNQHGKRKKNNQNKKARHGQDE